MRSAFAAALFVPLALFAGCLGGGGGGAEAGAEHAVAPNDSQAPTTDAGVTAADGTPVALPPNALLFPIDASSVRTRWINGTFAAQDAFRVHDGLPPTNPAGNPGSFRSYDITDLFPPGVPVTVLAEIHAEMAQGDLDFWFQAPNDEFWTNHVEAPYGGWTKIQNLMAHTGTNPITINVFYDVLEPIQELAYTISVRLEYKADVLPPGIAVGFEVPEPDATVRFERAGPAANGAQPALLLWDPDDTFLGRYAFAESVDVPLGDAAGEFVVLLAAGSGEARASLLNTTAEVGRFRVMIQEIVSGDPHAVGPGVDSGDAWTYDSERAPLQTGFFFLSGDVATDVRASLEGPHGPIGLIEGGQGPFFFSGWGFATAMGDERLTAGTYTVTIELGHAATTDGRFAQHWIVYYARQ